MGTYNDLENNKPENIKSENKKEPIDLFLFMGQSNMAGRGVAADAPLVPKGWGYEFRAISDPTKLYQVEEPFGVKENNPIGIHEPGMKTGSCVSAFIKAYYSVSNRKIVGVSASKGGSSIIEWQPNSPYLKDVIERLKVTTTWLIENGYNIQHRYMVWLQGETDGDLNMSKEDYTTYIKAMIGEMVDNYGIEKCFVIRIGNHRDLPSQYDNIISAQTDLCKTYDKTVMVSLRLTEYATSGGMKDEFHYVQAAYNEFGAEAGLNTAYYVMNEKEPTMQDRKLQC